MVYHLFMAVGGVGVLLTLWVVFERITRGARAGGPEDEACAEERIGCGSCRAGSGCTPSAR